jgi:predicted transcriptional regulator
MKGWICLHRKFLKWEWAGDPNMVALFVYLLLMANTDDGYKWKGISLNRGQLLTGRKKLAKDTGLSEQTIRTCLKRLESTNEITIKSTNQYSIITICNYNTYQDETQNNNQQNNQQNNKRLTSNQPATNHIQQYDIYLNNILNYKETTSNENNYLNVKIQNFDLENSNSPLEQKNDFEKMFDDFRKSYKGNKRGLKAEFENLKKKRPKDWQDVIPKLMPALERMEQWREQAKQAKKFVPDYAMLQTWINQCRWETEYETINENGSKETGGYTQTDGAGTSNYDAEF